MLEFVDLIINNIINNCGMYYYFELFAFPLLLFLLFFLIIGAVVFNIFIFVWKYFDIFLILLLSLIHCKLTLGYIFEIKLITSLHISVS